MVALSLLGAALMERAILATSSLVSCFVLSLWYCGLRCIVFTVRSSSVKTDGLFQRPAYQNGIEYERGEGEEWEVIYYSN